MALRGRPEPPELHAWLWERVLPRAVTVSLRSCLGLGVCHIFATHSCAASRRVFLRGARCSPLRAIRSGLSHSPAVRCGLLRLAALC